MNLSPFYLRQVYVTCGSSQTILPIGRQESQQESFSGLVVMKSNVIHVNLLLSSANFI